MPPKFLGGPTPDIAGNDRRDVLAEWLASPENPYFATNLANIVWAHFFGRGIIHEVDDVRVSNPPSIAELLGELGQTIHRQPLRFQETGARHLHLAHVSAFVADQRIQRRRRAQLLAQPGPPHAGRSAAWMSSRR